MRATILPSRNWPIWQKRADVFISYSRKDKEFVAKLDEALKAYKLPKGLNLEQRNLDVFLDTEDFTGNDYKESVARRLNNCGKLLLVCSPNARRSSYVNDEVKVFAEAKGAKNIVPLLISGMPNNWAEHGRYRNEYNVYVRDPDVSRNTRDLRRQSRFDPSMWLNY